MSARSLDNDLCIPLLWLVCTRDLISIWGYVIMFLCHLLGTTGTRTDLLIFLELVDATCTHVLTTYWCIIKGKSYNIEGVSSSPRRTKRVVCKAKKREIRRPMKFGHRIWTTVRWFCRTTSAMHSLRPRTRNPFAPSWKLSTVFVAYHERRPIASTVIAQALVRRLRAAHRGLREDYHDWGWILFI